MSDWCEWKCEDKAKDKNSDGVAEFIRIEDLGSNQDSVRDKTNQGRHGYRS